MIIHTDQRCTFGCAVLNLAIAGLLNDEPEPLSRALDTVRLEAPEELCSALDPITNGEIPETLQMSGYVVHRLHGARFGASDLLDRWLSSIETGDGLTQLSFRLREH